LGNLTRKAAIVGVAESDLGIVPDKTAMELMAQAAARALNDAGLTKGDIDALFCTGMVGMPTARLAEYLQIQPVYSDSTATGGASFEMHVQHAVAAIAAGLCHTALICFGASSKSDFASIWRAWNDPVSPEHEFESIFGTYIITPYAMAAQRHMHRFGTTSEQLAEIAVATRKWAFLNPLATMREPITNADVLNSPLVKIGRAHV
jgi:acetyl-CoA acetyltransferase